MYSKYLNRISFLLLSGLCLFLINIALGQELPKKPNVVLIYTDDVGYGDISAMGGEIPTPNIDLLFKQGLTFTNAYSSSATCTPSRYSLLTGEYAWRAAGRGVAPGNASALIEDGRETLATIFQKSDYQTTVIGKWHLGLGGPEGPDWNGEIKPGPLEIGFDEAFLIPATGDRVPTVFVKDRNVVNLDPKDPIQVSYKGKIGNWPTGKENPEQLTTMYSHGHDQTITNGISRIGYMTGGKSALWRDEDISDILVEKALSFMEENTGSPFFMYFSTHDIHVPRIAHERWQGKSGFGPRGDVLLQLDEAVGELLKKIKDLGIEENTIVIFTSDNGPVLDDGYIDLAEEMIGAHKAAGPLRGGKYSAFEAGTRIPFAVFGAGIPVGKNQNALFSQVDLLASFAKFLGVNRDTSSSIDSEDHWEVLVGESNKSRSGLIQGAVQGVLSYVSAEGFKYIPPSNGEAMIPWGPKIESGFSAKPQLYDLNKDPNESTNLAERMPAKLSELVLEWKSIISKE